ncbi:MAG: hypothetical protein NZ992_02310 [Candidatus Korarchaeum sp.]|nr:hypothetical protein [Candidatus Korarchaeum sp.]MDW8035014.1 V-type ATPase subunit subunit G family protein [Candidatus Korarchaeum sp.]
MPRLVEAIIEAEKEAARIIENAEAEAKRIIELAEDEARRIIEEAKSLPLEAALMQELDIEERRIFTEAIKKADELRKNATDRVERMIDEIVREVVLGE